MPWMHSSIWNVVATSLKRAILMCSLKSFLYFQNLRAAIIRKEAASKPQAVGKRQVCRGMEKSKMKEE